MNPQVTACPGCGRTTSIVFQNLADDIQNYIKESMVQWREKYPGIEKLNVKGERNEQRNPCR